MEERPRRKTMHTLGNIQTKITKFVEKRRRYVILLCILAYFLTDYFSSTIITRKPKNYGSNSSLASIGSTFSYDTNKLNDPCGLNLEEMVNIFID